MCVPVCMCACARLCARALPRISMYTCETCVRVGSHQSTPILLVRKVYGLLLRWAHKLFIKEAVEGLRGENIGFSSDHAALDATSLPFHAVSYLIAAALHRSLSRADTSSVEIPS